MITYCWTLNQIHCKIYFSNVHNLRPSSHILIHTLFWCNNGNQDERPQASGLFIGAATHPPPSKGCIEPFILVPQCNFFPLLIIIRGIVWSVIAARAVIVRSVFVRGGSRSWKVKHFELVPDGGYVQSLDLGPLFQSNYIISCKFDMTSHCVKLLELMPTHVI